MKWMIRLRYCILVVVAGLAAVLGGCTDRALLREPVAALSGPYRLDAGDQLRVVVYDQPSLTNIYEVDQSGRVSMPLIGDVPARDATTDELAQRVKARLASAYLRDPDVTVEVNEYRPFFVLGEVNAPGQYAYVPGITAETAVAMAGGFSDRANKRSVRVSRTVNGKLFEARMAVIEPIRPGDTIYVPESLF
jgi:polysaccharide export outer membrane protein